MCGLSESESIQEPCEKGEIRVSEHDEDGVQVGTSMSTHGKFSLGDLVTPFGKRRFLSQSARQRQSATRPFHIRSGLRCVQHGAPARGARAGKYQAPTLSDNS